MTVPFGGLGVALITIFGEDGAVLPEATAEHAVRLAGLGVRHVTVCGSTGEASRLTPEERVLLIGAVRGALPPSVTVLAGTGAPDAETAAAYTAQAREAGAGAILALAPPGSRDLDGYYAAVRRAAAGLPLLAYHFPPVSAPGIPLDEVARLPVDGLKDSTADAERITAEITGWGGAVFVGSAAMLGLAHRLGAAGAILGIANAEPEICAAALAGDAGAQAAVDELRPLAERDFPSGMKLLTARRFGTPTVVRRPAAMQEGAR